MQVALISRDDSLKRLCSGALTAMPGRYWNLLVAAPGDPPPAGFDGFAGAARLVAATRDRAAIYLAAQEVGRETA